MSDENARSRQAYATIRGFVYQGWRTVRHWVENAQDPSAQVVCEGVEDVDILRGGPDDRLHSTFEQDKILRALGKRDLDKVLREFYGHYADHPVGSFTYVFSCAYVDLPKSLEWARGWTPDGGAEDLVRHMTERDIGTPELRENFVTRVRLDLLECKDLLDAIFDEIRTIRRSLGEYLEGRGHGDALVLTLQLARSLFAEVMERSSSASPLVRTLGSDDLGKATHAFLEGPFLYADQRMTERDLAALLQPLRSIPRTDPTVVVEVEGRLERRLGCLIPPDRVLTLADRCPEDTEYRIVVPDLDEGIVVGAHVRHRDDAALILELDMRDTRTLEKVVVSGRFVPTAAERSPADDRPSAASLGESGEPVEPVFGDVVDGRFVPDVPGGQFVGAPLVAGLEFLGLVGSDGRVEPLAKLLGGQAAACAALWGLDFFHVHHWLGGNRRSALAKPVHTALEIPFAGNVRKQCDRVATELFQDHLGFVAKLAARGLEQSQPMREFLLAVLPGVFRFPTAEDGDVLSAGALFDETLELLMARRDGRRARFRPTSSGVYRGLKNASFDPPPTGVRGKLADRPKEELVAHIGEWLNTQGMGFAELSTIDQSVRWINKLLSRLNMDGHVYFVRPQIGTDEEERGWAKLADALEKFDMQIVELDQSGGFSDAESEVVFAIRDLH
ncbi:MAG: hypothetical protein GY711_07440 [bacterium]|nr:hypothetical protein [bacterium]